MCVRHNLWLASDEAYRELFYAEGRAVSVWGLSEKEVPGIEGRRIGLESSSKVWNACGLRIGALVTDNEEFHRRAVAENTANLCPNAIGQYIFGALAHESRQDLSAWYEQQREYYRGLLARITGELARQVPGLIVSTPDASIYSVLDVREVAKPGFDAQDFVMYCHPRRTDLQSVRVDTGEAERWRDAGRSGGLARGSLRLLRSQAHGPFVDCHRHRPDLRGEARMKLRKNWVLLARGYDVCDPDLYNERETGKTVPDRKRKCQAPAYTAWIQVTGGRVRTHGEVPRDVVLAVLGHVQNRKT